MVKKLAATSPDDCAISTISLFELVAGALKSNSPNSELSKVTKLAETIFILPLDEDAATKAGAVRLQLENAGQKIGAYDTLLAGHALSVGLTFVTDNISEFKRVENLNVENWRTT